MIDNNEIHMVIDENYTATVRNLKAIEVYLSEQKTISKYFGEITYINDDCDKDFRNSVKEIRDNHIKIFNQPSEDVSSVGNHLEVASPHKDYVGDYYVVYRNQGDRDAAIVSTSGDDILVEYEMPNGTTALNIIKPDGSYKAISYAKLQTSKKWIKNLDENFLINNPQSGKKFEIK